MKQIPGTRKIDPSELRRANRELVDFDTRAMVRGRTHDVRVVNISPLGLMGRTDADMRRGDRLIVELPHLRNVEAVVRWVEDGRIGTEFVPPISVDDYALLLMAMPRRQTAW